jgi:hypothetical protein
MTTPVAANDNEKKRTHANENIRLGTIRPLDASDPRNIYHPCHAEQWLELARVLGRLEAREEYESIHKERETDGIAETEISSQAA